MQFGDRLKQQRKIKKLTQDEVAEKLNVSRQTISSWENEKSYPDIKSLISLSDMYDISLDTMLKEDSGMKEFIEKNDLSKKLLGLRCSIASFTMFALLLYFLNSVNAISSTYKNATIFLMYVLFVLILLSFNKFIKSINLERSQISDTFRLNKYLKFILAALLIATIELARYHIILPLIIFIAALEIFIFIYYFRNK
ncbi:helix-turn-helix domain-containing protein [Apilactobacillus sp. 1-1-2]|uniref:helix-turn-helix domain-containing protein n=1 Tax=Apilactobacillus sp. 1-1-2 TaxID=3411035 RepID=UPI003B932460